MFLLIEKCDLCRIKYEIESGCNFDAIFRVRPDSLLESNPFDEWLNSGCDLLFFHDPNDDRFLWGPVNDQVFVGTSAAMSEISNVYTSIMEIGDQIDWFLPTSAVHEVLVSESALSWHTPSARRHYKIASTKTATKLLRPEIQLRFVGWEGWLKRVLEAPKLLKHFLKVYLIGG